MTHATHPALTRTARRTIEPRPGLRPRPTRTNGRRTPLDLDEASRLTEAERLAAALAGWYAETLRGRRDVRQLRDLLTPTVEHRVRGAVLRERARTRLGSPSTSAMVAVRRTLVHRVADRYEAVVMVDDGRRIRAVATTLHPTATGWIVSELARPEDHVPALAPPTVR